MKILIKKLQILLLLAGIIFPMSAGATQSRVGGTTNENVIRYVSELKKVRAEEQKTIRKLAEMKGQARTTLGNEQSLSDNNVAENKSKIFDNLKALKEAKRKKVWLEKQIQRNVRAQKDNHAAQMELSESISIDSAELTGSISGTVTDSTGVGIAGIWVDVLDDGYNYLGYEQTGPDGTYTVTGLPAGNHRVQFYASEAGYISEWYNNKADFYSADPVAVTAGATTAGIDAVLEVGGSISGTVTDSTGAGIAGIWVDVLDDGYNYLGYEQTGPDGTYTVIGLPAGNHRVQFYASEAGYISEWYDDAPQFECATPVTVTTGSTVAGIDAVLELGGSISGTVTDSTGAGISGVQVVVQVVVHDDSYNYLGYEQTGPDGTYTVTGLPTGNHRVQFDSSGTDYASEWYNNKADFFAANPVAVTAGATTAGIDAVLALGGSISGTVTDSTGTGIAGIWVDVYDDGYNYLKSMSTGPDGTYTVTGLPTGNHRVQFYAYGTDYIAEWYNNKADFSTADPVAVAAGAATAGIDAVLQVGGSISGTVTDSTGTGIAGIWVDVYDDGYNYLKSMSTGPDGTYTVTGLPAGNHRVQFYAYGTDYIAEWYNNKADFSTADPVAVAAGAATAGINASLAKLSLSRGGISGRVIKGGQAFKCTQVTVYDADYNWAEYDWTDYQGNYLIEGLETGSYKVQFYNQYEDVTQWYNNKKDFDNADQVNVVAPDATTGIDASFDGRAVITPILMLLLL